VFRLGRCHWDDPFRPNSNQEGQCVSSSQEEPLRYKVHQVVALGGYDEAIRFPVMKYESDRLYDFYNVLWIQYGHDGVAYRAGCGHVFKEAWDSNNTVKKRVVLG
jgi:hypothetical protein